MKLKIKHIVPLLCFAFAFSHSIGQSKEKLDLNEGVAAYKKGEYGTAQDKFEKAYQANNNYNQALYNAANSAYRNGDFEKATEYYEQYAGTLTDKNTKAKAYHNLGNVFLKQDKLKESIEAYKTSLRNNPNDEDTRYNLSYALSKLRRQEQQQKENKDDKEGDEENKDDQKESDEKKDGDKKDGDKSDSDKDGEKSDEEKDGEKDKENKDGEGDKDEKKDEQGDPNKPKDEKGKEKEMEGKMSKGQIEKDLEAINEDEKAILERIAKKKGDKKGGNNTKDW